MDEKEMETTLPTIEDTVSDAPPEPEAPQSSESVLEEYSYGNPTEEKETTEAETVSSETAFMNDEHEEQGAEEASTTGFAYGKESSEGAGSEWTSSPAPEPKEDAQKEPSAFGYERKENAHSESASTGYNYGENHQQGTPPPSGYHYGGDNRQGTPPPNNSYGSNYQQGYTPKRNNGMALASLILGILSVVMCCCGGFGVILGAVGIVLAILSRGREPMETNAKAGLFLSIGGIVLGIVVLILAFAMVGSNELQSELYRRSQGNYEDYSHYFDHDGL